MLLEMAQALEASAIGGWCNMGTIIKGIQATLEEDLEYKNGYGVIWGVISDCQATLVKSYGLGD